MRGCKAGFAVVVVSGLMAAFALNFATAANAARFSTAPVWQKHLAPLATTAPGYQRTIIHLHSVFSHDACDHQPFVNGAPNEDCFQDLQRSLCEVNTDIVFVTEHSAHLSEHRFGDAWHSQPGDVPIMEKGMQTGVIRTCADGHRVHIYLGSENELMPIGLTRHPDPVAGLTLDQTYVGRSREAIEKFREAGALVGVAHSERAVNTIEYLKSVPIDFMEIYNLHAEFLMLRDRKNYLGLADRIFNIFRFYTEPRLEPDLLFLTLQTENHAALDKWAALALRRHITGTAGTDVHENVTTAKLSDGERLDSYRRTQRWFSNYVRVADPADRVAVLRSIREGKLFVVFEVYGTPQGFDFAAETENGTAEMGDEIKRRGHYKVRLRMPKLLLAGVEAKNAELEGRIYAATEQGWRLVKVGTSSVVEFESDSPGVFRAEVKVRPRHLMRYIPGMFAFDRQYTWIYSNPVWIR